MTSFTLWTPEQTQLISSAIAPGCSQDELRLRDMRVIADCQTLSLPSWALRNESAITSDDF